MNLCKDELDLIIGLIDGVQTSGLDILAKRELHARLDGIKKKLQSRGQSCE